MLKGRTDRSSCCTRRGTNEIDCKSGKGGGRGKRSATQGSDSGGGEKPEYSHQWAIWGKEGKRDERGQGESEDGEIESGGGNGRCEGEEQESDGDG